MFKLILSRTHIGEVSRMATLPEVSWCQDRFLELP